MQAYNYVKVFFYLTKVTYPRGRCRPCAATAFVSWSSAGAPPVSGHRQRIFSKCPCTAMLVCLYFFFTQFFRWHILFLVCLLWIHTERTSFASDLCFGYIFLLLPLFVADSRYSHAPSKITEAFFIGTTFQLPQSFSALRYYCSRLHIHTATLTIYRFSWIFHESPKI